MCRFPHKRRLSYQKTAWHRYRIGAWQSFSANLGNLFSKFNLIVDLAKLCTTKLWLAKIVRGNLMFSQYKIKFFENFRNKMSPESFVSTLMGTLARILHQLQANTYTSHHTASCGRGWGALTWTSFLSEFSFDISLSKVLVYISKLPLHWRLMSHFFKSFPLLLNGRLKDLLLKLKNVLFSVECN